jgi:hypothetical protein
MVPRQPARFDAMARPHRQTLARHRCQYLLVTVNWKLQPTDCPLDRDLPCGGGTNEDRVLGGKEGGT